MKKPYIIPSLSKSDIKRFWSKVAVRYPQECWTWKGTKFSDGYGGFWLKDQIYKSHRISYFVANHKDPGRLLVCHSCDTKDCVNPNHLFLGTYLDNSLDMTSKGRQCKGKRMSAIRKKAAARGSKNGSAKVSENDVIKMRSLYKSGFPCSQLIKVFNITKGHFHKIIRYELWQHI